MSYLISINPATGEILHPEVVKLTESLSLLDDKELLYVVLYTDYNSIYKQHPEHERKRRAMWHSFNDNVYDIVDSQRILIAVKEYTSLQFDPDIELRRRLQQKIDKFLDILDADDSPTGVDKTTKAINSLRAQIIALDQKTEEQTRAEGVIRGDRQLSFLEKIKLNKKRYLAIIKER